MVAIVAMAAFFGLTIGYLPLNMIILPLLPIVLLTFLIIWIMPENRNPPTKFMAVMFFSYAVAVVAWPYYLAIQVPGLPLIEIRRAFAALSIFGFLICFSTSMNFRNDLRNICAASPFEMKLFWIFLVFQTLAVPASVDIMSSIPNYLKYQTGWTAIFFIVAYTMTKPGNMARFSKTMIFLAVFLALLGFAENRNQGLLWANHIPSFLKVSDPAMKNLLEPVFREDAYRVTGPFSTSLSYAEFMSMALPFFIHYIVEGKNLWLRGLTVICEVAVLYAIYLTHARVGIVGILAAHGAYFVAWTLRKWSQDRNNIMASLILFGMPVAMVLSVATVLTVPALRIATLGGGAQSASTNGRLEQMEAAIPLILKRPIIGYGPGEGAGVLDYRNPAGELSIDSYILAGALNYGLVGFLVMAAMYGFFVLKGIRAGQEGSGEISIAVPAATGIAVWMVAKIVLAQEDNMSVVYMLMGVVLAAVYRVQQEKAPALARSPRSEPGLRERFKARWRRAVTG